MKQLADLKRKNAEVAKSFDVTSSLFTKTASDKQGTIDSTFKYEPSQEFDKNIVKQSFAVPKKLTDHHFVRAQNRLIREKNKSIPKMNVQ